MTGAGLGGIFGAIAKHLIPFAQKYILPHAVNAVRNVTSDAIAGKSSLKDSLKTHGLGALKGVRQQILDQTGSGRRPRKKSTQKRVVAKAKQQPKVKKNSKTKKVAKKIVKKTAPKKIAAKKSAPKRRKIKKEELDGRYLF